MAADSEVLIASAHLETRRTIANVLSHWGLEAICCSTMSEAKALVAREAVSLAFCEDRLADGSFRELLSAAKLGQAKARVVVISRAGDGNAQLEARQLGAFDAIPYPCRLADVQQAIFHAMRDGRPKPSDPASRDVCQMNVFYDRWRAAVSRFCCLFLGREDLASMCTCEAFLNFLREEPVPPTNGFPARLMGLALAAVERHSDAVSRVNESCQSLRDALLSLPRDERATFIVRGVLEMSVSSISLATGLSEERVRDLWRRSLLRLREMLPRSFFERGK